MKGDYCAHAWLAVLGLPAAGGRRGHWVLSCRTLSGVLGERPRRREGHLLQSSGPLSGVPGECSSSRKWLHLPVAWEEHWALQAATPVAERAFSSPYFSLCDLFLSAEGHNTKC